MARVLIPIAEGFEELEAVTLIDLLRRADIEVTVAGLSGEEPVRGSRGTVILADTPLDDVMDLDFDMIVLPGGLPGADNLNADPRIHQILKRMAREGRYTCAICAAPTVLAKAGLLSGRRATSFPGHLEALGMDEITLVDESVVEDGKVVTSRGPGTAMDFALRLIEILQGRARREQVEAPLQRPA